MWFYAEIWAKMAEVSRGTLNYSDDQGDNLRNSHLGFYVKLKTRKMIKLIF